MCASWMSRSIAPGCGQTKTVLISLVAPMPGPGGARRTYNLRTVDLYVAEKLGVAAAVHHELANRVVAELDLFFADRRRRVGRETDEVDVLERGERVRSADLLDVALDQTGKVESRRLKVGQGRDCRGDCRRKVRQVETRDQPLRSSRHSRCKRARTDLNVRDIGLGGDA